MSAGSAAQIAPGFLGKAIFIVPLAFAIGLALSDLSKGEAEEAAIVEKRVQQRMGVWKPPALTAEDRVALERERDAVRAEIAKTEARMSTRRLRDEAAAAGRRSLDSPPAAAQPPPR